MAWKVVKQLATKGDDGSGSFVDGVDVTYENDQGVTDTVFFPRSQYNVDNVKATLTGINATHDAVANLTG